MKTQLVETCEKPGHHRLRVHPEVDRGNTAENSGPGGYEHPWSSIVPQHRESTNDSDEAEFSIDYAFMTRDGQVELERNMEDKDKVGACQVLVGCDHKSKAIWAMVVREKGPTESTVKWLVGKLDQSG